MAEIRAVTDRTFVKMTAVGNMVIRKTGTLLELYEYEVKKKEKKFSRLVPV